MPTYKVTDQTSGTSLKLTGDSPPTEVELIEIFSKVGGKVSAPSIREQMQINREQYQKEFFPGKEDVLKYGGAMAGSLIGTPLGSMGMLAGGALGYAIGAEVSKIGKPRTIGQAFIEIGESLKTGTEQELTGGILTGGISGITKAISESNIPKRLYESAIKLPISKKWTQVLPGKEISEREIAARAGLKSEVPPSEYGITKATKLEKEAKIAVDDIIQIGAQKGDWVNRDAILNKGVQKAYASASKSSDPKGAKKIVDIIVDNFKAHPDRIRVDDLNDIKKQLYTEVKWGSLESTGIGAQLAEDAKKGIAHEAKVYLEKLYPELKELNATDASYIALKQAIERATGRIANADVIPMTAKILFRPSMWPAAIMEATIGHPQVKTHLAFALSKARYIQGKGFSRPIAYEVTKEEEK